MKKNSRIPFAVVLALVFSSPSLALGGVKFRVGAGAGYYSVKDTSFKDIYEKNGNTTFSAHAGVDLLKFLEMRGDVSYFSTQGRMTLSEEDLKFSLTSMTVGLRAKIAVSIFTPYAGIGIAKFSVKEDYPERFDDVSESGTGSYFEAGTYMKLGNFYIDFNVASLDVKTNYYGEKYPLGGLKAGISIGYQFKFGK